MVTKILSKWRPALSWTCVITVAAALIAYTPAVARDGGTWTLPYSGTAASSGSLVYLHNTGTADGLEAHSDSAVGVYGISAGSTSNAIGTIGICSSSSSGFGVVGYNSASTGVAVGTYGVTASGDGLGVYGVNAAVGHGAGVYGVGYASTGNSYGVTGISNNSIGVYGKGLGYGVYGIGSAATGQTFGVYGLSSYVGVLGFGSPPGSGNIGVYASGDTGVSAHSDSGDAVYGVTTSGNGVHGKSGAGGYAGYFEGNVNITGTLTSGVKDFKIDHPLDPANKYLVHSCVESSEMKDIYDGVAILDSDGKAEVHMPDYFQALNKEFRYQLTAIGAPAPNLYIAREMEDNRFVIAGGDPGMKVSWQVTGVRQDAYAAAHPLQVEPVKPAKERGKYLYPVELGKSRTLGIGYEEREAQRKRTARFAAMPPMPKAPPVVKLPLPMR